MRLDHLLSRETSEARDCGAKPEVEARKRKGARANGSGREDIEAAKSREPGKIERSEINRSIKAGERN